MINQQNKWVPLLGMFFLVVSIVGLGYVFPRDNFPGILAVFSIGFVGMWTLSKRETNVQQIFYLGIALRAILIMAIPSLSDDYFRFLWDGMLIHEGINPFEHKPSEILNWFPTEYARELYNGMNSPNYFTVYPPVNQWMFFLASFTKSVFGGIVVLRIIILGFEIGTFLILKKVIERFSLHPNRLVLYWLNPLVIIELTGNLHGEGILIFFLVWALYSFAKLKDSKGGALIAFSVLSKLFSLMFFPILLLKARMFRSRKIILASIPLMIVCFLPFINWNNYDHFLASLDLYFQKFEFNGSIFNLVRWVGIQIHGHDIIQIAGPVLSGIAFVLILLISWLYRFRNRLVMFKAITLIFATYLFFSPIIHPWYVILPLALSLFTQLKFPLAWSAMAFLSYGFYSAELSPAFKNLLIAIEYLVVYGVLFSDLKKSWSPIKFKAALSN